MVQDKAKPWLYTQYAILLSLSDPQFIADSRKCPQTFDTFWEVRMLLGVLMSLWRQPRRISLCHKVNCYLSNHNSLEIPEIFLFGTFFYCKL